MASLPKALLLDLDDTLLDFDSGADGCWQAACQQYLSALPGVSVEQFLTAIETHRQWYWGDPERHRRGRLNLDVARQEVVAGALQRLGLDIPEVANQIAQTYIELREAGLRLFPDSLETLRRLRTLGIKMALITNGWAEGQRRKVERFGLTPLFDCILIEGEFGIGKPDERVYFHALEQLGVTPSEAWMVGDNLEWEVAAPQRLGMKGIWYDVKGHGLPPSSPVRPDRIISRLADLLEGP